LEATASPYAFIGSGDQEAVTVENQRWSVPDHTYGRTAAHPGWSIHLSDERLGAGLPRQDISAVASQGTAFQTAARTKGFVSIMDQNKFDVPFLVFKFGGDNVVCEGFIGYETPRLFVRKLGGELYEVDVTKPTTAEYVTSAESATDARLYPVTVEVKRTTTAAQVTPFGPFQKYAGRQSVRTDGHEIVMTYQLQSGETKTYRLLAGARAVSC
jgi:hypothetical protein